MTRCQSCSAPLVANINLCRYCGTRNDVDLHGKHSYQMHTHASDRICPECQIPLQTIDLNLHGEFLIERCDKCYGLFFDPGEIETLLDSSVSNVFHINDELMRNINRERYQGHKKVKYLKCPVCQVLMNRSNFGHRSGVVIDRCRDHGIWLESGEISHLMEWKKAGGQMLSEQKKQQAESQPDRPAPARKSSNFDSIMNSRHDDINLVDSVSDMIFRLFD